jgi:catechol 2,3-dioxygenase-like lactoylglutathione lyase family enzyme
VLSSAHLTGFVATVDAARAKRFYQTTLGLQLVSEDPFALVFECGGNQLRVQILKEFRAQPFTVLGWQVADIRTVVAALSAGGVTLERYAGMKQDELGVWRSPSGARVAWFKDPDGNLLSVTELAAA